MQTTKLAPSYPAVTEKRARGEGARGRAVTPPHDCRCPRAQAGAGLRGCPPQIWPGHSKVCTVLTQPSSYHLWRSDTLCPKGPPHSPSFRNGLHLSLLSSLLQLFLGTVPKPTHPLPHETPALSSQGPSDRWLRGQALLPSVSPRARHRLGTHSTCAPVHTPGTLSRINAVSTLRAAAFGHALRAHFPESCS